ncbi:MAG: hypothetical protein KF729_06850 [Sandaracinaceae bacterium]|nr:hypothetical protein [Sandaracinaceae bacterium]
MHEEDRAPGEGFLVLWLGGPGAWEPRVHGRLGAAGVRVEGVGLDVLVERACGRAPDLVVLTGAAADAPRDIVARLAAKHPAGAIPVIAIGAPERARPKPRSHYGLVASLDRDTEPDTLAKQIVALLRGLSRRPAKWRIKAGRADLAAVTERFTKNARSGLLVAPGAGAIAFDHEAGVAPPPEVLLTALASRELEHLTLHERPPGRVRLLDEVPPEDQTAPPLAGTRVVVIDADLGRAGRLAQRIEAAGAQARAVELDRGAIAAARSLDPTAIVVSAHGLARAACEPLWSEPRLADAALLVASERALSLPAAQLLPCIAERCAVEVALRARLAKGESLAERLETLGTARWLKVLGKIPGDVTLRVYAAAGRGRVDLSGGRVRGAAFRPSDGRMAGIDGRAAIDALMALPFGRVLAGSAEGIGRLEGVRSARRTSIIGEIGETPAERVARPRTGKGLVAEEVFLHAPDRTGKPADSFAPERARREPTTHPPPGVPIDGLGDDDDDFDLPTRNYTADAMAELQAELRSAAKLSERAPEPPRRRVPSEPPAPLTPRPPAPAPRAEESLFDPTPPRPTSSAPPAARSDPPARAPASVRPLPPPLAGGPAPDAAPSARRNAPWFAAGVAVALLAGGYAAWRLSAEPTAPALGAPTATPAPARPPGEARPAPEDDRPSEGTTSPEPVDDDALGAEPPEPAGEDAQEDHEVEPGAIRLPPEDATVDELLAQAAAAQRRAHFTAAETYARQALAIAPAHAGAAYRLALSLHRQRRYEEALSWTERADEWDPADPRASALRGDVYMRMGRFMSAAGAYRAALEVEPNFGPAQRGLERLRARGVE